MRVNDERIDSSRELANAIGLKGSGESVEIEFLRSGGKRSVTAELGELRAASPRVARIFIPA